MSEPIADVPSWPKAADLGHVIGRSAIWGTPDVSHAHAPAHGRGEGGAGQRPRPGSQGLADKDGELSRIGDNYRKIWSFGVTQLRDWRHCGQS